VRHPERLDAARQRAVQPRKAIANSADSRAAGTVGSKDLPLAINGQDIAFNPTATWAMGMQRGPGGYAVDVTSAL
jgi:hypothetical protein